MSDKQKDVQSVLLGIIAVILIAALAFAFHVYQTKN